MLEADERKELKRQAHKLKPEISIGKNGIGENMLRDLKLVLKKRHLVKIRVHRSAQEGQGMDALIQTVVTSIGCELVERRGFCFTIYKEP